MNSSFFWGSQKNIHQTPFRYSVLWHNFPTPWFNSPGSLRLLCLFTKDFQLGHDDAMISLYQWPMISDQRPARISDQWSVYISSSVLLALNMPSPCLLLLAEASRQLMDPKGCEATETLRSSVSIATCVIIIVIICNAAAADLLIVTSPISA